MQLRRLPEGIKKHYKTKDERLKALQEAFNSLLHNSNICPISVGMSGVKGYTLTVYYGYGHYNVYELFHGDTLNIQSFVNALYRDYD